MTAAIASGKGGTGKTTIAVNLAQEEWMDRQDDGTVASREAGRCGGGHRAGCGAGGPRFVSSDAAAAGALRNEHKEGNMRIAIPMAAGKLSQHFGHCERFALLDVDQAAKSIIGKQELESPEHQPGLLPRWLAERGATLIIAGGMGASAQRLFAESGIQVVIGAPIETPEALVASYMSGTLQTGGNLCDH